MAVSRLTATLADLPWVVKAVGGAVVMGVVLVTVFRRRRHKKRTEYPRDTVILHQIGRGPHVPSLTPFAIKLETYFRLENIPHQNVHSFELSSKKKFPWIEYNGQSVPDSEFILEYLSRERGLDLYSGLTQEQISIGRAFQKMVEENTYWCVVFDRWVLDKSRGAYQAIGVPWFLYWTRLRMIRRICYAQGIGRHTEEEVRHIMSGDLRALSFFLGSKKFLFGDKPNKFDCAIFGLLAEIHWASFGGFSASVIKEYRNLCDYCERMKDTFWPDWQEVTTKGCTK